MQAWERKARSRTFDCKNRNLCAYLISLHAFSMSLVNGFWFDDQHQAHGTLNSSQLCDDRFARIYGKEMRINKSVAVVTDRILLAHFNVIYCV